MKVLNKLVFTNQSQSPLLQKEIKNREDFKHLKIFFLIFQHKSLNFIMNNGKKTLKINTKTVNVKILMLNKLFFRGQTSSITFFSLLRLFFFLFFMFGLWF